VLIPFFANMRPAIVWLSGLVFAFFVASVTSYWIAVAFAIGAIFGWMASNYFGGRLTNLT
jgi:hypothetical protein